MASGILLLSLMPLLLAAGVLFPYLKSGEELVRLRNSLIFDLADASSFRWKPSSIPPGFIEETGEPPVLFRDIAAELTTQSESEFGKALRLAGHLASSPDRSGKAVQADIERTYKAIVEQGEGYCADYTLVFTGLAHAVGVPVREWGISFDGFGGDGHAFTEIYDRTLQKWILVDSFYSFYVTDAGGMPLSVLEVYGYLAGNEPGALHVVPINEAQFMFPSFEFALQYYNRGAEQLFMIWGDNVFAYDENWLVRAASHISRSAEQLAGIILGLQPRIMVRPTPSNESAIEELRRLRAYLWLGIVSGISALVAASMLIALRIARRGRKGPARNDA